MSPEDRRAAIVEAVMPLVAERGLDTTSRELADAAGVAEGTLFRAFGDKACLIGEVALAGLMRASAPASTRADLESIDMRLPLVERVRQVIERGQQRSEEAVVWMTVLRSMHARECAADQDDAHRRRAEEIRARLTAQHEMRRAVVAESLGRVLAQDRDRLRVPIAVAVAMIEAVTAHRRAGPERIDPPLPADVLADVLVHGIVDQADTLADVLADALTHEIADTPRHGTSRHGTSHHSEEH